MTEQLRQGSFPSRAQLIDTDFELAGDTQGAVGVGDAQFRDRDPQFRHACFERGTVLGSRYDA